MRKHSALPLVVARVLPGAMSYGALVRLPWKQD